MSFILFDKELCDSCYKCLRVCPTKSIRFSQNERSIVDAMCIKCGMCALQCPKHALVIKNSVDKVIEFINGPEQTVASLAPSYVSAFGMSEPKGISSALKKLGFDFVEETAIGAEIVSRQYEKLLDIGAENIITSCCPSANDLIASQYPSLVSNILPVVSPMIAHGLYIKERYGKDTKVVFIGPCLSKMAEAEENAHAVDAVITFRNLQEWLKNEGIDLYAEKKNCFDKTGSLRGKAYPLYDGNFESKGKYHHLRVDGVENCKQVLGEIESGALSGYAIDISICNGSCVNGPEMPGGSEGRYEREMRLQRYVNGCKGKDKKVDIDSDVISVQKEFYPKETGEKKPTEKEIREILMISGKFTKEEELNCGACGYSTCKEKAAAVFNGWSDPKDCLPYLRDKAESKQALMIENTPNAICIVNSHMFIEECNPSFTRTFSKYGERVEGIPVGYFLKDTLIEKVFKTGKSIIGHKIYEKDIDMHFIMNVIYSVEESIVFVFLNDITASERKKKDLENVKIETLKKTQEVIDKQMRVAQEIAGLLGETTAETKISLNSLKKLVLEDE